LVKIRGEVWSARSVSDEIAANYNVDIIDIDGATLIVKQSTSV
ncbi:MAG: NfeD-like C-terminal, partner-binding, partial [Actinomycetota bacterium]